MPHAAYLANDQISIRAPASVPPHRRRLTRHQQHVYTLRISIPTTGRQMGVCLHEISFAYIMQVSKQQFWGSKIHQKLLLNLKLCTWNSSICTAIKYMVIYQKLTDLSHIRSELIGKTGKCNSDEAWTQVTLKIVLKTARVIGLSVPQVAPRCETFSHFNHQQLWYRPAEDHLDHQRQHIQTMEFSIPILQPAGVRGHGEGGGGACLHDNNSPCLI